MAQWRHMNAIPLPQRPSYKGKMPLMLRPHVGVIAFGNALGNSIVGKIQQTEREKQIAEQKDIERLSNMVDWDKALKQASGDYLDVNGELVPYSALSVNNNLVQDDSFKQFQNGELPQERGFWDAIPHDDKPSAVETEIGFSASFKLPFIGKVEFGYAASIAFDNYGNVAFAPLAFDSGKDVLSSDWSLGTSFSVLEGGGLLAKDIAYGHIATGGPNVDLLELSKAKFLSDKLPSPYLTFDYEIGSAFTDSGAVPVRGFEFGLDLSTGGSRVGADVTHQYSTNQNIISDWGVVGQLIWAYQNIGIQSANSVLYKGMDNVLQEYANPRLPTNLIDKKD